MVWALAGPVLHPLNPRLIYATASGYGISGPNRSDLAMDLTVQAASGIMSVTGFADGPPVRTGVTVADFMGGIHAYGAIMTALFEREHSGVGRLVEVAMQEAVYFTLAGPMEQYRRRGKVPERSGNGAGGATSPYRRVRGEGWLCRHSHRNGSALVQHPGGGGPHRSDRRSAAANDAWPQSTYRGGYRGRRHLDRFADQSGNRRRKAAGSAFL